MNRAQWVGLLQDWGLAFVITVVVVGAWQWLTPAPPSSGDAPTLAVHTVDGGDFALEDVTADTVVVNFWATWCGPCRREIPEFAAFAAAHPDVAVLGVSVDEGLEGPQLLAAATRLGITYDVLHDRDMSAARAWGVTNYPTTFVLDAHRHVIASQVGMVDQRWLEARVGQAFHAK